MASSVELIVVENRFTEMFQYLPNITVTQEQSQVDYSPVFKYGDKKALDKFLIDNRAGVSPYPLIWLLWPYVEKHLRNKVQLTGVTLIVAVKNNITMNVENRMDATFKDILNPLVQNIQRLLLANNITHMEHDFNIVKYANYGNTVETKDKTYTLDTWDAIKMNFDCTINNNCLKAIKI